MKKYKLLFAFLTIVIVLSMAIMPGAQAISDSGTLQPESTPSAQDKYFFFEAFTNVHGVGDVGPAMEIDFPTYSIRSNPFQVESYTEIELTENTLAIMASGTSRTGTAGGGIGSGLSTYESYSAKDNFEWKAESDGTLNFKHGDEWIKLAVGETFEDTKDITPEGYTGTLTETFTVKNYGFIDKSCVITPNKPTPTPKPTPYNKDKYLLFEFVGNYHGTGKTCNGPMMDGGEMYSICSNPLEFEYSYIQGLTENTVVLFANIFKLSGSAGGGESRSIGAYDSYSYSASDGCDWNIEADGTLNFNNAGKWVKLAIGETYEDTQDVTPEGSTDKLLWKVTIRNYGFIDKSCVYKLPTSTQPVPTSLRMDINHPGYMEKGDWTTLPYTSDFFKEGRLTKTVGSFAKWSFNVPADGNYEISFFPGIIGAKYEVFQSGKLIDENYFKDYDNYGFTPAFSDTFKIYQLKKGARISVKVTLTEKGKELGIAKLSFTGTTDRIPVTSASLYKYGVSGKLSAKDCKSDMFTYDSKLDCIGSCDDGDYVSIPVDYGSGLTVPELLIVNAAIPDNNAEKSIEVRLDAVDGKLLGTMTLDTTGSKSVFQNQSVFFNNLKDGKYMDSPCSCKGPHEIFLVFKGSKDIGNFRSFEVTWTNPGLGSNYWSKLIEGPELPKTPVGDVDDNGQINSIDLALMTRYLLGKASELPADNDMWAADINEDDLINSIDCGYLRKYLLGITPHLPKY